MLMIKMNVVREVTDGEVAKYRALGYVPYAEEVAEEEKPKKTARTPKKSAKS